MPDARHVELFGVPVRAETMDDAVAAIVERIRQRRPTIHVVINALKVSEMARHPSVRETVLKFDMIHADGASVVWASRLLGHPLPERVAGIDLMLRLVQAAATHGFRIFLLGAKPGIAEEVAARLTRDNLGLEIVGTHHGYWKEIDADEERAVADRIRAARADMLFVAMPTPRKENFLIRNRSSLDVPFAMGVGGAFDVVAGVVRRAPLSWQKAGMEWAYRLLQEPQKMWKRYLVTNSHFLWLTLKAWLAPRPH